MARPAALLGLQAPPGLLGAPPDAADVAALAARAFAAGALAAPRPPPAYNRAAGADPASRPPRLDATRALEAAGVAPTRTAFRNLALPD